MALAGGFAPRVPPSASTSVGRVAPALLRKLLPLLLLLRPARAQFEPAWCNSSFAVACYGVRSYVSGTAWFDTTANDNSIVSAALNRNGAPVDISTGWDVEMGAPVGILFDAIPSVSNPSGQLGVAFATGQPTPAIDFGGFTFAIWVYPLLQKDAILLSIGGPSELELWTQSGFYNDGTFDAVPQAAPQPYRWTHVAMVRNSTVCAFYLNGQPNGVVDISASPAPMNPPSFIGLGSNQFNTDGYDTAFVGLIGQVVVLNAVLTPGQISTMYSDTQAVALPWSLPMPPDTPSAPPDAPPSPPPSPAPPLPPAPPAPTAVQAPPGWSNPVRALGGDNDLGQSDDNLLQITLPIPISFYGVSTNLVTVSNNGIVTPYEPLECAPAFLISQPACALLTSALSILQLLLRRHAGGARRSSSGGVLC